MITATSNVMVMAILTIFLALSNARTDKLPGPAVPFQMISGDEYKAILELSNGSPIVTQNRLINSGSQVISGIVNNILNGLVNPVNLTALDPVYNSLFKPAGSKAQGYPLCVVPINRHALHSQRSYDLVADQASNYGSFSINFFHPTSIETDNFDEDISVDEEDSAYQKPNLGVSSTSAPPRYPTSNPNPSPTDALKEKPTVFNCIVVLKQPSMPFTQNLYPFQQPLLLQPRPPRPTSRPAYYPHPPTIIAPQYPRDPQYPIGPLQIVPLPYPPFIGLLHPAESAQNAARWPNSWSSSQGLPSAPSGSAIPPTWPYWMLGSSVPSVADVQGNKSPSSPLTWPFWAIPSSQTAATQNPTTSPYIPSAFWPSISTDSTNLPVHDPSIPFQQQQNPSASAWYNSLGVYNQNQLQQQINENANEGRSAIQNDGITPEFEEVQGEPTARDIVGAIQTSQKKQTARIKENQLKVIPKA